MNLTRKQPPPIGPVQHCLWGQFISPILSLIANNLTYSTPFMRYRPGKHGSVLIIAVSLYKWRIVWYNHILT